MQFISIHFLFFLALAVTGYQCCAAKHRYIFILFCNILFYASWISTPVSALPLIIVVLVTWAGALLSQSGKWHITKIFSIFVCVMLLLYYKYADFFVKNINVLFQLAGKPQMLPLNPIAPIGISFFTFQSLGYVIDVVRGKTVPEKNLLRYAAYVSFFPTITSGPIERSQNLLHQLQEGNAEPSFANFRQGLILFIYGAFVKLVISDRLAVIANTIMQGHFIHAAYKTVINESMINNEKQFSFDDAQILNDSGGIYILMYNTFTKDYVCTKQIYLDNSSGQIVLA